MVAVTNRNIVLHLPGVEPPPVSPEFHRLVADCGLWWDMYGVHLVNADVDVREARVNVNTDEPWLAVAAWWQDQPDYDPAAVCTTFLSGWDSPLYIGWGGRLGSGGGLSVVGEYAIKRILTTPLTPDDPTDWQDPAALVDDRQAGHLYLHEKGHELGLSHDHSTPGAVMGYEGWFGYNAILGQPSADALAARFDRSDEHEAFLYVQACRRLKDAPWKQHFG